MKRAITLLQIVWLRVKLQTPALANFLGGLCLSGAALAAKLGDFSGVILWKFITLQHVVVVAGVSGGALSRLAVKNPVELQKQIADLKASKV